MQPLPSSGRLRARLSLPDRSPDVAEQMAELLRNLGFQVEQVSPRGVSFSGQKQLLETVFHSRIDTSEGRVAFEAAPTLPDGMAKVGANVYLPTRPQYFA